MVSSAGWIFVLCKAKLPSLLAVGCITVPWYGLRQPCRLKVGNWTRCAGTVAAIFPCTAPHLFSSFYSIHLLSLVVTDCGNRAGLHMASRRDRGELQAHLPPSYPCALLQTALECGLALSKITQSQCQSILSFFCTTVSCIWCQVFVQGSSLKTYMDSVP